MSEVTREEFADAVAAAVSSVHHLYREVNRLISSLSEALADPPYSLVVLSGTVGRTPREGSRIVVRYEYGILYSAASTDDDDADDEEVSDDEAEDEDADGRRRRRRPAEIAANQPLLCVRIALYDPNAAAAFEPHLSFGVVDRWSIGNTPSQANDRFILPRYMLRRIPKVLQSAAGGQPLSRVQTAAAAKGSTNARRAADRKLSCRLPCGVETVPLYALDSVGELERVARTMKDMWSRIPGTDSPDTTTARPRQSVRTDKR